MKNPNCQKVTENLFPKKNHDLRISYNIVPPYFSFKPDEDDIDVETIEGLVLRSLIDKYHLTTTWSYEGFNWGRQDENGTFNGVIGRVNVVFT